MISLFFHFNGSNNIDDAIAAGATRVGRHTNMVLLKSSIIGVTYVTSQAARIVCDGLHPNLKSLPGVNGVLTQAHVAHIAKEWPSAKVGDAFKGILAALYAAEQNEHFNPNNH